MLDNILLFTTKNAYVQTKNLPKPKKITRAALGLLGTFSMSDADAKLGQLRLQVCTHHVQLPGDGQPQPQNPLES